MWSSVLHIRENFKQNMCRILDTFSKKQQNQAKMIYLQYTGHSLPNQTPKHQKIGCNFKHYLFALNPTASMQPAECIGDKPVSQS